MSERNELEALKVFKTTVLLALGRKPYDEAGASEVGVWILELRKAVDQEEARLGFVRESVALQRESRARQMSMREQFANSALNGLLAAGHGRDYVARDAVVEAFEIADRMMAARATKEQ